MKPAVETRKQIQSVGYKWLDNLIFAAGRRSVKFKLLEELTRIDRYPVIQIHHDKPLKQSRTVRINRSRGSNITRISWHRIRSQSVVLDEGDELVLQLHRLLVHGIVDVKAVLFPDILHHLHTPFPSALLQLLVVPDSDIHQVILLRHEHQHLLAPQPRQVLLRRLQPRIRQPAVRGAHVQPHLVVVRPAEVRMHQYDPRRPHPLRQPDRPDPGRQRVRDVAPGAVPADEDPPEVGVLVQPRLRPVPAGVARHPPERGPGPHRPDPGGQRVRYVPPGAVAADEDPPEVGVLVQPRVGPVSVGVARDPPERGPRVLVAGRYGPSREEPVLNGNGDRPGLSRDGAGEVVVAMGEGGLHAEPAAVNVEEEGELPARVGDAGQEDPSGHGRVR
ncbi:hypothetical protein EUGRSUZ_I01164 [Eucalyptus grandis]|uniref:Uncharacterized protein n=2 Tax=Eucalyptus grandis TaxID=71139 RepID=A0ACC3JES9_EUCGR|nr:hypothetical protein EUGRSUZ_I01164 [Eucalyptus grandis]